MTNPHLPWGQNLVKPKGSWVRMLHLSSMIRLGDMLMLRSPGRNHSQIPSPPDNFYSIDKFDSINYAFAI